MPRYPVRTRANSKNAEELSNGKCTTNQRVCKKVDTMTGNRDFGHSALDLQSHLAPKPVGYTIVTHDF